MIAYIIYPAAGGASVALFSQNGTLSTLLAQLVSAAALSRCQNSLPVFAARFGAPHRVASRGERSATYTKMEQVHGAGW